MKNDYGEDLDRNGYAQSLFKATKCVLCGSRGELVRHEIYGGTRRSNAKAYGAWMTLCPRCHEDIHAHPADYAHLKEITQKAMQDAYGMDTDEFIEKFGKNYREDIEC